MEATVASLIAEASGQPASPQADSLTPVSDWFDVPRSAASSSAQTTLLASGVHSFQMGTEHASRIERALESLVLNEVTSRSSSATEHRRILHALRADSAGAPSGQQTPPVFEQMLGRLRSGFLTRAQLLAFCTDQTTHLLLAPDPGNAETEERRAPPLLDAFVFSRC